MSERALRKLRRNFITVAMTALLSTMFLVAGLIYAGNSIISREVIQATLEYIVENDGNLVQWDSDSDEEITPTGNQLLSEIFSTGSAYQSQEFTYTTRYFAVFFDENMEVTEVKANHITSVSEEDAETYGKAAIEKYFSFGRIDDYYYQVDERDDGTTLVVYLDGSSVVRSNERLLYLALILIGFGMVIAFLLVRFLASKAIHREVESAELQKQFMTNISHELKTPLAVIRANTEMQEILGEENEWTQSTMRQIDRMNGLIQNLVMISRADEQHGPAETEKVDITKAVTETVENFRSMAVKSGKHLETEIAENVTMEADESQIRQLGSLLVDNAIKYCDDEGTVTVSVVQKGKGIILTVSNNYEEGATVDYSKFFERFYRKDASHNVDKEGYGIGLSIAESLVKQYKGTINASWKNGVISFTCQLRTAW